MKFISAYSKIVAILTMSSGVLALLCLVLLAITFASHPEAISDPVQMLLIKDVNIPLLRVAMLADIAGYYLLFLPLIYLPASIPASKQPMDGFTYLLWHRLCLGRGYWGGYYSGGNLPLV